MSAEDNKNMLGFTADQQFEIQEGIRSGLDVSVYAKPEFMSIQMREIRLGLLDGLPVGRYASNAYDWFQMEEIREGLRSGIDVEKYADFSVPFDVMRQIRRGLEEGIDISAAKKLPAGILKELRYAAKSKVDIIKYIKQGYDEEQIKQIRIALEKGLDIDPYLSLSHRGVSICQIRLGLEDKIDVTAYAKTEMNWRQMREIRIGMEKRLDVTLYMNPFYSWQQMREIRLGLEANLPVEAYSSLMYTANEMSKRRLAMVGRSGNARHERSAEKYDGFSLRISPDAMEVTAVVESGENKIDKDKLIDALKQNGVTNGIDYSAIVNIAEGRVPGNAVVVARGTRPENGKDGWYEYFFETELKSKPKLMEDGSVDYQSMKWFEMVQRGQRVALYHRAETGKPGCNVAGEVILPQKGKELKLLAGKGFILLPDQETYVADMDGKIELKDNRLEITNVLILDNVNIATGNIDFSGSVYIKGTVGDGVTVRAGEDILVEGFIESAVLEAGGDIILKKGNNPGGRGNIKAGNDVFGKFFENAYVSAKGNIRANYCMNSELYAYGKIKIFGRNGMLAGGNIYAAHGIEAYNIGNKMGIVTKLKLGRGENIAERATELTDREKTVNRELLLLKNAYFEFQKKYPAEKRNNNPVYLKLEDAIYTKELEMGEIYEDKEKLEAEKNKFDKAKAVIRGTVFEGTQIDISGVLWNAKEIKNVTIKKWDNRIYIYGNYGKR